MSSYYQTAPLYTYKKDCDFEMKNELKMATNYVLSQNCCLNCCKRKQKAYLTVCQSNTSSLVLVSSPYDD